MHEEIVAYLRECPEGVTNTEIAVKFLKIAKPGNLAGAAVKSILSKDCRVFEDSNGLWHAKNTAQASDSLALLPLTGVYILGTKDRLYYLSLWNILPEPSLKWEAWTGDAQYLSYDDRQMLNIDSEPENCLDRGMVCSQVAEELQSQLPVFLSFNDENLLRSVCARYGEYFTDDSLLAGELLKAASIPFSRPLSLDSLSEAVTGQQRTTVRMLARGQQFSECLGELFTILRQKGIETCKDLENKNREERSRYFEGKKYSFDDINSLPSTPGVYGFKDAQGKYLYIGKAKNLKRRMMCYFRETEESPVKIQSIRKESMEIVTYQCGSELECLLYEYRLIKKHKPSLNNKIEISERSGSYTPIEDCIVLLPHTDQEKAMSFWFRKDQKIQIKTLNLDLNSDDLLTREIDEFFLKGKLIADSQDFPELEIATRWVKKYRDSLTIVPVSRLGSAEEISANLINYLGELNEGREPIL